MIYQFNIQNFKCFPIQDVNLNHLSVLAGANGVGKSTVIQALLLMRQTVEALSYHDNPINLNLDSRSHILLNGPFHLSLGNTNDIVNSSTNSNIIEFYTQNASKDNIKFSYDADEGKLSLLLRTSDSILSSIPDLSICAKEFHYLNAERLGPRNIQTAIDQDYINTGCQGEYTGHAIASIETLNLRLAKEDKRLLQIDNEIYLTLKKQIEAWMDYIIPHIQLNIDSFPQINSVRVSLRNETSKTGFLHPSNIGFGITYALPIIVSGLVAQKGCMLIVENPEAHLHPSSQSKIGQFLAHVAAAGIQVIVETHSEHIVNGIRLAVLKQVVSSQNVVINFFRQKDRSEMPIIDPLTLDSSGNLSMWPNGFFDQEELDLAELFRMKKQ